MNYEKLGRQVADAVIRSTEPLSTKLTRRGILNVVEASITYFGKRSTHVQDTKVSLKEREVKLPNVADVSLLTGFKLKEVPNVKPHQLFELTRRGHRVGQIGYDPNALYKYMTIHYASDEVSDSPSSLQEAVNALVSTHLSYIARK